MYIYIYTIHVVMIHACFNVSFDFCMLYNATIHSEEEGYVIRSVYVPGMLS